MFFMAIYMLFVHAFFTAKNMNNPDKPKYIKTPFAEQREKYFKETGLNELVPRGKQKWGKTSSSIVDD